MDIYESNIAWMVGKINKELPYAITTSKDCARYSCSKELVTDKWRKHEDTHKAQYAKLGWFGFVIAYLLESIKHGYYNNKFEIEAREASK